MSYKSSQRIIRKAFTVWEMGLTMVMIGILAVVLFMVTDPTGAAVNASRATDEFVLKAMQRAIVIYEADNPTENSLFPLDAERGFYLICNQKAKTCTTASKENKYINLNMLVDKEYLTHIPNHSEYSNAQINGFVLYYNKTDHPPIIMTYGEWETLGSPK